MSLPVLFIYLFCISHSFTYSNVHCKYRLYCILNIKRVLDHKYERIRAALFETQSVTFNCLF